MTVATAHPSICGRGQVTIKIITEDDEMSSDIVVQGDEEEVTRFLKTLDLREKGMVYVKGILES